MTEKKPEVVKIVRTEGGYALYNKLGSKNPNVVCISPREVLDWVVERLSEWDYDFNPNAGSGDYSERVEAV